MLVVVLIIIVVVVTFVVIFILLFIHFIFVVFTLDRLLFLLNSKDAKNIDKSTSNPITSHGSRRKSPARVKHVGVRVRPSRRPHPDIDDKDTTSEGRGETWSHLVIEFFTAVTNSGLFSALDATVRRHGLLCGRRRLRAAIGISECRHRASLKRSNGGMKDVCCGVEERRQGFVSARRGKLAKRPECDAGKSLVYKVSK